MTLRKMPMGQRLFKATSFDAKVIATVLFVLWARGDVHGGWWAAMVFVSATLEAIYMHKYQEESY